MDYAKIYDGLICNARNRKLSSYTEEHHIIPSCIGGSNERSNLVDLTQKSIMLRINFW